MEVIEIKPFISFTITIILLFIGKIAISKSPLLQRYSIRNRLLAVLFVQGWSHYFIMFLK